MENEKYIFACINGTPFSESVCDYSVWLSDKFSVKIKLFHSIDHSSQEVAPDLSGNIGFDARDELMKELVEIEHERGRLLQRRGKIILERAKNRVERRGGTDPKLCLQNGGMVENLKALQDKMEIVVMGRYGQNHIAKPEKAIGNRVESAIRSLEKPILVISQPFDEPKSLLLAYDNSENSKKALMYLRRTDGLKSLVVHVVFVGAKSEDSDRFLNEASLHLQTSGYSNTRTECLSGATDEALLTYINRNNIGLTVMGAFGHHWLRKLLIGSFTSKMLSVSEHPLFLVR